MDAPRQELVAAPPQIELRNVAVMTLDNPFEPVLEDVNWEIKAGAYWVIGALPASGKSDLLATAAGLRRPMRGVHRLFGRETSDAGGDEALRERLRVGLVFGEGGRLFQQLTVADNVALPFCYHRDCSPVQSHSAVQEVLELTGLDSLSNYATGRIARGWRQRAALARALILKPEVLVLDNPLAGLDPKQEAWWLEFLGQLSTGHEFLNRRPMTLVVATDDLRPWLSRGRDFGILKENRWLPIGDRDDLARCQEPLLRELLAVSGELSQ